MASEVEICNIALSHLGDSATVSSIDPPEGSAQAEHCKTFYPIARDALLELYDWKFASRRSTMAAIATHTTAWDYVYAPPADMLKARDLIPDDTTDDNIISYVSTSAYATEVYRRTSEVVVPYDMETLSNGDEVIMTDLLDAIVRYTVRITDSTKFTPLFVLSLSHYLASLLAGPIIKGEPGAQQAKQSEAMAIAMVETAFASDKSQERLNPAHIPSWLNDR